MRTQYGSHVTVIGKDPENERFLYCKRDDGSELWADVGQLVGQNDEDLNLLADHSSLPDAPKYAL